MRKTRLTVIALAVIALLATFAAPTAFAADLAPEEEQAEAVKTTATKVKVTERNGVQYISTTAKSKPVTGVSKDAYGYGSGSGWTVRWKNVISSNVGPADWVRYYYAETKRLSGSGSYKVDAHATLIEGSSYGGEQVFSAFLVACAGKVEVSKTAKTCSSSRFDTSPGEKWLVVSGHWYDHGNNGSQDGTCSGCIDWVWTASS